MPKILFISLFFSLLLCASESFKETRYIYSIDQELQYKGAITFGEDSIKIEYSEPKHEVIEYRYDDENPQKKYFFLILKSIYAEDTLFLNEFFFVRDDANETMLLPKELIKNVIKQVHFKKENKVLEFLHIDMKNDDWIKIETLR
jgi:hypothetical protein